MTQPANDTLPDTLDADLGFAAPHDVPIPYMHRTRTYYAALGYERAYRWAQYVDVPFTTLRKPLSQSRVGVVTTAAPYDPDKGDQGPGAPYNSAAKFFNVYALPVDPEPDLRISHVGIDRDNTTASDKNTWNPLAQMKRLADEGRIGALSPRIIGCPTNRSQKTTVEVDAPMVLEALRKDGADVAVLLANCPVCHQSISLTARHLEANGIATVVMGCAKDIVEHVGVARFLFSDFPLGNPAGRPGDEASQRATLEMALDVLESATGPRTTRQSPIRWADNPDWKLAYSNVEQIAPEDLEQRRAEFNRQKEIAKAKRAADATAVASGVTAAE